MDEILDILLKEKQPDSNIFDFEFSVELSVANDVDCDCLKENIHEINDKSKIIDLIYLNYDKLKSYYSKLEQKQKNLLINLNDHSYYRTHGNDLIQQLQSVKREIRPTKVFFQVQKLWKEIEVLKLMNVNRELLETEQELRLRWETLSSLLHEIDTLDASDDEDTLKAQLKKSKVALYQYHNYYFLLNTFYHDLLDDLL